jgi:hypothetical protein
VLAFKLSDDEHRQWNFLSRSSFTRLLFLGIIKRRCSITPVKILIKAMMDAMTHKIDFHYKERELNQIKVSYFQFKSTWCEYDSL